MAQIEFQQVRKVYASPADSGTDEGAGESVVAVDDVSLQVAAGETLCLIGPSGSGKTTLLRMINRLVEPSRGSVRVGGTDVRQADPISLRRSIGYVIQRGGLFPHRNVAGNIGLLCHLEGWGEERTRARVEELLELVNLPPGEYAGRLPRELSGGEQQRVSIARALSLDPPVLLMDEPFGALDPMTRARLHGEFRRLQAAVRKTVVLVTHELSEAFELGDRVALLHAGRLVQVGSQDDLRQRPADDFVETFLGSPFAAGGPDA